MFLEKEETLHGEWEKTVSGCDGANNLDFESSLHRFVILIAGYCHYQKFYI